MKKYIVMFSVLALVSVSLAEVLFKEDFSGYAGPGPLVAPQVGTWTQNGGTINIATYHILLDGTVGPCMEFVDGTAHLIPSLEANFISYTASPIKITYDFKMRRADGYNDQQFVAFAGAAGEQVAYSMMQDANSTQDWIYMFGKTPSGITSYLVASDTWYTMEMELPVMPASGTFSMKWTIYDATGTAIHTESNQTSWSENAGADLIDELVFRAGGGVSDLTSMLIDNILVETVPEPATIWILGWRGNHPSFFQSTCFSANWRTGCLPFLVREPPQPFGVEFCKRHPVKSSSYMPL